MNVLLKRRLVRRWRQHRKNISRRLLRDSADPLALDPEMFVRIYRVTKEMYSYLCHILRKKIAAPQRCTGITIETKILITLNFLATGSYQKPVGQDWLVPVSQPTASRSIEEIVEALNHYISTYIRFPATKQEQNKIKQGFYEKFGMPEVIGCIDGTLIAIAAPRSHISEAAFFTKQGYHAINTAIICDSDSKIIGICAKFGGAAHDIYVWHSWSLSQYLEEQYTNGMTSWLLGDSGYLQKPWLMTPMPHTLENTPEAHYNKMHVNAHMCVAQCIGLLKARWQCLSSQRVLHYEPTKCAKIVNACAILHNLCLNDGITFPFDHGYETYTNNNPLDSKALDSIIDNESRQQLITTLWENRTTNLI